MGGLVSQIQSFCGRPRIRKATIAIVGLDGAGKTTILYQLKLNKAVYTVPTATHLRETLDIVDGFSLVMWDIGMGAKAGPLRIWMVAMCQAFMYVVDSTATDRFCEAKEELLGYLQSEDLPFIVLANKQDLEGACPPSELACYLNLERFRPLKWDIIGCSALTGEGLKEAVEKLCTMIKEEGSQPRK